MEADRLIREALQALKARIANDTAAAEKLEAILGDPTPAPAKPAPKRRRKAARTQSTKREDIRQWMRELGADGFTIPELATAFELTEGRCYEIVRPLVAEGLLSKTAEPNSGRGPSRQRYTWVGVEASARTPVDGYLSTARDQKYTTEHTGDGVVKVTSPNGGNWTFVSLTDPNEAKAQLEAIGVKL